MSNSSGFLPSFWACSRKHLTNSPGIWKGLNFSGYAQQQVSQSNWQSLQAVLLKLLHSSHNGCQFEISSLPPLSLGTLWSCWNPVSFVVLPHAAHTWLYFARRGSELPCNKTRRTLHVCIYTNPWFLAEFDWKLFQQDDKADAERNSS